MHYNALICEYKSAALAKLCCPRICLSKGSLPVGNNILNTYSLSFDIINVGYVSDYL